MIPCTLRRYIRPYHKADVKASPRFGQYVQSFFHSVKGYGKKCWAVCVEIDLDYHDASQSQSDEEIIKNCIEYLNTPPKSKYGKRRRRRTTYGTFREEPYRFWVKRPDGQRPYIQALLLTAKKENNKFWGEGPLL